MILSALTLCLWVVSTELLFQSSPSDTSIHESVIPQLPQGDEETLPKQTLPGDAGHTRSYVLPYEGATFLPNVSGNETTALGTPTPVVLSETLRIWNLPYGVWVEISKDGKQKVLYQHRDATGLRPVDVQFDGIEGYNEDNPYHVNMIRVAQTPNALRKGDLLFEDEVSFVPGYLVELDFVREKSQKDFLRQVDRNHLRFGRPDLPIPAAFVATTSPKPAAPIAVAPQDSGCLDCLKTSLKFEPVKRTEGFPGRFVLTDVSGLKISSEPPPDGVRVLQLTGPKKTIELASSEWLLSADGEVRINNNSAILPIKKFVGLKFKLVRQETRSDETSVTSWLEINRDNFEEGIKGEVNKYLTDNVPKQNWHEGTFTLSEVRILLGSGKELIYRSEEPIVIHLKLSR